MPDGQDIQVRMCEVRIGRGNDVLRAILGSCVGIGLLWRRRGVYGMAHCLLPESPHGPPEQGAKYVTGAMPSLLAMMELERRQHEEVEAVVAGGACMVQHASMPRHGLIGEQNARMAQRLLAETRIRVVHVDVGGDSGRQLVIDCAQHQFAVKTIGRTT
ncbi:chemotaxis protein CheD [Dyella jiangningensis]|uniref:chemotaxis protein CheD n=1 Tax=Dyella sp. AtDHG13 TaxID=1938897 RepID=UPI00088BE047|nr:chemotaxis protein CheD [Dyella sp. AtDHG13]PXV61794.1 chemotaxis protein CheD [Dyella sp. AtDHG13]SDJ63636.1 chemotaxis protein CheD [Dyella jiangningensis]